MKTRAATLGALVLSTIVAHAAAAAGAARLTVFNGATCRENGGTQLLALTSPGSGQCGTVPATPISYTVTCDADGNGGSAFVCDGSSESSRLAPSEFSLLLYATLACCCCGESDLRLNPLCPFPLMPMQAAASLAASARRLSRSATMSASAGRHCPLATSATACPSFALRPAAAAVAQRSRQRRARAATRWCSSRLQWASSSACSPCFAPCSATLRRSSCAH